MSSVLARQLYVRARRADQALVEDGRVDVPAIIVAYDLQWPWQVERLRVQVDEALAGVEHVTEHIGSTAVPGLAAKPVIDLDVVVADQAAEAVAIDALTAAGWQHEGDLGIAGRAAFRPRAGTAYHHLYVVTRGSQAHRDHIDLRTTYANIPARQHGTPNSSTISRRCSGQIAQPI